MPLGGAVGRVNPEGRAFRVDDNFRILMQWNRSTYFGASAGARADALVETAN